MGSGRSTIFLGTRFDRSRLDPEIVKLVKAASLVEYNGAAYAHHLCRIFADDPNFMRPRAAGARRKSSTAKRWRAGPRLPIPNSISMQPSGAFRPAFGSISIALPHAADRARAR